jgi:uncharacterized protein YlxP (DUF503 family)
VRSVAQRIRNKFEVSVAEVADNEAWQRATLGVAVVANEARHCDEVLREIVDYVQQSRLDTELLDVETEVIAFG